MKQYEYARMKMPSPTSRVGDTPDWEATELSWLNELGKIGWRVVVGDGQASINSPCFCGNRVLFIREVEPTVLTGFVSPE